MTEERLEEDENGFFSSKFSTAVNFLGAFCTLIGLIEIIRLVVSYWGTYGLLANFPLEISVYAIGLIWTSVAFFRLNGLKF